MIKNRSLRLIKRIANAVNSDVKIKNKYPYNQLEKLLEIVAKTTMTPQYIISKKIKRKSVFNLKILTAIITCAKAVKN